jgi:PqqD family protein of HPr-rel-A system
MRCWDGECVVYDGTSGATHLLSGAHAGVLTHLIEHGSCDAQTLHAICSPHADADGQEVVMELTRLDLCRDAAT